MNKIIKKLKIPGYETSTVIKPRNHHSLKEINDVQLSLNFEDMKTTNTDKEK
ncbi:hypothetical protein [Lysinibacillus sp. SGAir0095]|uniref:hypothetical protein n=1 Tax=Lysinibacillus sp. SGAir0095 TaxID=2070463 RepID=UPI00143D5AD2|nr:hypothetical protein [Lysinibacillus sp. SGAir0095]